MYLKLILRGRYFLITKKIRGLTDVEAHKRVATFGLNELEKGEKESIWEKIKE